MLEAVFKLNKSRSCKLDSFSNYFLVGRGFDKEIIIKLWFQVRVRPNTTVKVLYPIIPSGINPSIGIGPTQEQRKTLIRVGFEPTTFGLDHRRSTD